MLDVVSDGGLHRNVRAEEGASRPERRSDSTQHLPRARLVVHDVEPSDKVEGPDEGRDIATLVGAFDLVTGFDIVHDQARPREVLRAIRASLRPGGTFLCADVAMQSSVGDNIEHPLGPWFYTFSLMHCMTVSLASEGEGLG